jgi:hypothetical protein
VSKELSDANYELVDATLRKWFEDSSSYVSHRMNKVFDLLPILEMPEVDRQRLNWSLENAVEEIKHVIDSHNVNDCRNEIIEFIENLDEEKED